MFRKKKTRVWVNPTEIKEVVKNIIVSGDGPVMLSKIADFMGVEEINIIRAVNELLKEDAIEGELKITI